MDAVGRARYRGQLQGLLKDVEGLEEQFDDGGRAGRIAACIKHVITDIDVFAK